jgi:hypothetical protein
VIERVEEATLPPDAALTPLIFTCRKGLELEEARRKAAKLPADQWHLLKQAARSPDGKVQVTLPAMVVPAR